MIRWLNDCVFNRIATVGAREASNALERLCSGSATVGAHDRVPSIARRRAFDALNRNRRSGVGRPFHPRRCCEFLQEGARAAALLKEAVSANAGRHLVPSECATHGDHQNGREMPPNHREQLESRHARHVEIRKKDIGDFAADLAQCRAAVLGSAHTIPKFTKHVGHGRSDARLVVYNEDSFSRLGHIPPTQRINTGTSGKCLMNQGAKTDQLCTTRVDRRQIIGLPAGDGGRFALYAVSSGN